MAEVKLTCFGQGFMTLSVPSSEPGEPGTRLAYLQVIRDLPGQPVPPRADDDGFPAHTLTMRFYEFWSPQEWKRLFPEGSSSAYDLRRLCAEGEIIMRKVVKSPSGVMRVRTFDLSKAEWKVEEPPEGEDQYISIPKLLPVITLPYQFTVRTGTSTLE